MALYTAYFDESGHENDPMFTFGGLVLNVEHPAAFETEWLAAIDPLKELHTTPFLRGDEGFKQWNSEGLGWKQEILRRAARVIAKRSFQTFSTTLNMDDFSAINAEQNFDLKVAHPYAFCARYSVVQVGHWSGWNSIPGRVKMVFENRNKGDRLEVARFFARDHLDAPAFEGKNVLPLQAADLIAVIYARRNMKKDNFIQVQPAYAELNQTLHTNDNVGRSGLRSIWNRVNPLIIERPTPAGETPGVYFETDLTAKRKPFR